MGFAEFSRIVTAGHFTPPEEQIQILEAALAATAERTGKQGIPVILSGILPPPASVAEAIEAAGLTVAGDDIALISRTVARAPAVDSDPARYYAQFYANHFPCTTLLYQGDRRIKAMADLIEATGAAGVIFIGEKFCEYEYFEFPFMEKQLQEMGVATLTLEVAMDDRDHVDGFRTRIEAFAELLAGRV